MLNRQHTVQYRYSSLNLILGVNGLQYRESRGPRASCGAPAKTAREPPSAVVNEFVSTSS